ncbi:MAG: hypothetical protein WCB46_08950 [Methanoregula sp.]
MGAWAPGRSVFWSGSPGGLVIARGYHRNARAIVLINAVNGVVAASALMALAYVSF